MEKLVSLIIFFLIGWGAQFVDGTIGMLLVGGAIAAPIAAYLCNRLPIKVLGVSVGIALIGFNTRTILEVLL